LEPITFGLRQQPSNDIARFAADQVISTPIVTEIGFSVTLSWAILPGMRADGPSIWEMSGDILAQASEGGNIIQREPMDWRGWS
jgi:hypothetical protein